MRNIRILAIILAIVVFGCSTLVLTGCDEGAVSNGDVVTTDDDYDPTTDAVYAKFTGELEEGAVLQVLENDTAREVGYFSELLDAFNTMYSGYNITAVDANIDQYSDLANDGPYGYGPDVLYQANDIIMQYVDGQHILPLPYFDMDLDSYSAESLSAYQSTVSGVDYTFGVPVNIQSPVLFYRQDLLPDNWEVEWDDDNNGVPDMVEYWTELYAYSLEIIDSSGGTKYGYMQSIYDAYFSIGYLLSYGGYVFGGDDSSDTTDIGFSAGDSYLGAQVLMQLSSIMNENCLDDSISYNRYSMIGNGTYFATMTTPDVLSLFITELQAEYVSQGMSSSDAYDLACENIVIVEVPQLPASGDLTDRDGEMIDMVCMGGVNGYAISSYTKYPNASLAFIEFATSYEMISLRTEMLGIVPARTDVAAQAGELSEMVNSNLINGNIYIMPSVKAVVQIWTPSSTFFSDIAKDTFRSDGDKKYTTVALIKTGLENLDKQIYEAIHTLG